MKNEIGERGHDWMRLALCTQTDPETFYADDDTSTQQAKQVCRQCPVRRTCLAWALSTREPYGVWGGLDEDERRQLVAGQPGSALSLSREGVVR